MDFCPHCMRPATGPTCPHCGKPVAWQAQGQQLPLGTRLTGSGGLRAYATGAVLGQGGFGITYIAREVRTSQRVAIKECFPAQCAQRGADRVRAEAKPGADQVFARAQNSFLEEAKLLACQDALPAIVHVIDFFRANNTAYLVMEFLDGVTLEQKRRQAGGRLSAKLLLPMLRPLLRDLGKLHESGVIHRDISPDNLMWMPDNTLKLLDFGCARSMEDGRSMSVLLKHGFAPVEQYQTRGQGPETDIYALSATIYFCLTATMPPASVERLEEDALQPPTALGADLAPWEEEALLWGLAVQPKARPASMEQFASKLYNDADWGHGGKMETVSFNGGTTIAIGEPAPRPNNTTGKTSDETVSTDKTASRPAGRVAVVCAVAAGLVLVVCLAAAGISAATRALQSLGSAPTAAPQPAAPAGVGLLTGSPTPAPSAGVPSAIPSASPSAVPSASPTAEPVITGETEEGVQYEIRDEGAAITGYAGNAKILELPAEIEGQPVTAIAEEAFRGSAVQSVYLPTGLETLGESAFADSALRDLYVYTELDAPKSAFAGCEDLRGVVRMEDAANPGDWALPEDCVIFDENMETGIGSLRFIDVDDDGVIYGVTSQEEALLLHVPAGLEEVVMPDEVLGSTVTWVSTEALEDAEEGVVIHLADEAGFPYEMLFDAEWDFLQEDGETIFSCNWYLSCAMAQLINLDDQREADAPEVLPRRELVQAACIRAQELSELYDVGTRPDGSEWTTALRELGIDSGMGAATAAKAENDTELAERLRETVDERSAPTEAGYIETIGVGLYTAEDGMYYMYFVGHVPD